MLPAMCSRCWTKLHWCPAPKGEDPVAARHWWRASANTRFTFGGVTVRGEDMPFKLGMDGDGVMDLHYMDVCHTCAAVIGCECGRHGGLEADMYGFD